MLWNNKRNIITYEQEEDPINGLGLELVSNGNFTNDIVGWSSLNSGILTFDSGTLKVTNDTVQGKGEQILNLIIGDLYELSFEVTATSDSCEGGINNTTAFQSNLDVGSYKLRFKATQISHSLQFGPTNATSGLYVNVDNISLKKMNKLMPGEIWLNPRTGEKRSWDGGRWHSSVPGSLVGEHGYICGGNDGTSSLSSVERIKFPFNSGNSIFSGNLSTEKTNTCCCNSSNHGYNFGGYASDYLSTIDKITFPFNSGIATNAGNLSINKYNANAYNSSTHGYSSGGYQQLGNLSTIDKITFPFNSGIATNAGNLSQAYRGSASCNSSNHGYSCGGYTSDYQSMIDRITFPHDSGTSIHVGNLSASKTSLGGCNSSTNGYLCGGQSIPDISIIERILFPFDSGTTNNVGNLSQAYHNMGSCNSSNYGYICGGYSATGPTQFDIINRIAFPFSSGTSISIGNLNNTKYALCCTDETDFVTQFI